MSSPKRITAIVGSYRKNGAIHCLVDEVLAAAKEAGAEVAKIDLLDKHVEFCTNCRSCTQKEGTARGRCLLQDDMNSILDEIDRSDVIILASPMNFFTVTALMKRFIERLVCYAYWPWDKAAPKPRNPKQGKRALIVGTSAAPSLLVRWFTPMTGLLKKTARLLGAKKVDTLLVGLVAMNQQPDVGRRARNKARRLGARLAGP